MSDYSTNSYGNVENRIKTGLGSGLIDSFHEQSPLDGTKWISTSTFNGKTAKRLEMHDTRP